MTVSHSVRWGGILLSVALLASLTWGLSERAARREAEMLLSARYQQAFFGALGQIESVELLLTKALVSGSERERIRYLTELWQQAFTAQANLNALPLRQGTLMRTSQFLTQLGDFSFVAGQKIAAGEQLSDEERRQLERLRGEVEALASELAQVAKAAADGQMPWEEIRRRSNLNLNPLSKGLEAPEGSSGFLRIEQQMQEFPTLVYDGPFSDHVRSHSPRGLTGPEVGAREAEGIALRFVAGGESEGSGRAEIVTETGPDAPIAAWRVQVETESGPVYVVDVAKQGGHVLWMLQNELREAAEATHSLADAIAIAQAFLGARGFRGFEVSYAAVEQGRAIVPFVYVEDGVLIYPDQVKVTVALDRGTVVGFDGMQYYSFHHDRTLPTPSLAEHEALQRLHPSLQPETVRLALIPRPDLKEVLTYEVRARANDMLYHVYINAQSGEEEQILRIIESDDRGTMAI